MPFNVRIVREVEIEESWVRDLLCGAFEGGSNYWCGIKHYCNPEDEVVESKRLDLPFTNAGGVQLYDIEDESTMMPMLDRDTIAEGLNAMAEKYPNQFLQFIDGEDDAETADVFLQCCMFGEVVYG